MFPPTLTQQALSAVVIMFLAFTGSSSEHDWPGVLFPIAVERRTQRTASAQYERESRHDVGFEPTLQAYDLLPAPTATSVVTLGM